jgi:hypothetical protein
VDTDGWSDDAIGVRRSIFALAKAEGTKEINPRLPAIPTCRPIRDTKATCAQPHRWLFAIAKRMEIWYTIPTLPFFHFVGRDVDLSSLIFIGGKGI